MKTTSAAVVASMLLTACVVAQSDGAPAAGQRAGPSKLSSLLSAVNEMDNVDAALRLGGGAGRAALDDRDDERGWPWFPNDMELSKRAQGKRRRSGRRRYDAYGVAGRFGRSAE